MQKQLSDPDLGALATELGRSLQRAGRMLVTAESCTGGWVAEVLTSVAGSSAWYERGFVTYSNAAKSEMLGVSADTLARHGAVSEPTVRAMAEGAIARSHGQIAVAITGIAGPAGGTAEKPVGTVWFAWAQVGRETRAACYRLDGGREAIRRQSVAIALEGLIGIASESADEPG